MRSSDVVPFQLAPCADDLVLDLAAVGGLDEVHVLQQVRHAGLAVAFVARADQVGHVDRDLRVRRRPGYSSTRRPFGKSYSVMPPIEAFFWTPGGSVWANAEAHRQDARSGASGT